MTTARRHIKENFSEKKTWRFPKNGPVAISYMHTDTIHTSSLSGSENPDLMFCVGKTCIDVLIIMALISILFTFFKFGLYVSLGLFTIILMIILVFGSIGYWYLDDHMIIGIFNNL